MDNPGVRRKAPLLFRAICIWLALELAIAFIGPLCIPKSQYLSWYLGSKTLMATRKFLVGNAVLVPDKVAGWRNKPNVAIRNWVTDAQGCRFAHQQLGLAKKPMRIMMLGSSMVNGGTGVRNDQTISAYLEDDRVEVLNFGTMMYSMDQCLLRYRAELYKYGARELIVGIESGPTDGLKNLYVPFRMRDEANMPYLKPRFEFSGGSLKLVPVDPELQLTGVPQCRELLEFLGKHDDFYPHFSDYCRTGFSPLAASCQFLTYKALSLSGYFLPEKGRNDLLLALMDQMVKEARKHGAGVVFVMLPVQADLDRRGVHRFLPDVYARTLRTIRARNFVVVDGRRALLSSNEPASQLLSEDGIHYRPAANEVIADALRTIVKTRYSKETEGP